MEKKALIKAFNRLFGPGKPDLFFSPGRINLIGEHIDYNGGYVLPCAITLGTYGLARRRSDREVHVFSENFKEKGIITFSLDDIRFDKLDSWANYPKGVFLSLIKRGFQLNTGLDILYNGNIPNRAGLSSSASIELLTGVMLKKMEQLDVGQLELVKIGQEVENDFIGLDSGIMDQFAVGMGRKDTAMMLNCDTMDYKRVPIVLGDYEIVIMNTNKQRELADSKYNERRSECEQALQELQKALPVHSLCELRAADFEAHQSLIKDPVVRRRARHAVTENARTVEAAEKLESGDLKAFGELMNQSHRSLREDYEVTGVELDTLVEAAWQQDSVLGARMTGAGFGGCAIAIVKKEKVPVFTEQVGRVYQEKIGYPASFYVAEVAGGSKAIEERAAHE